MPGSSGSLVTAIKQKAKGNGRTAAMLLFYILQKYCLGKFPNFPKTCHHSAFQEPKVSVVNVTSPQNFARPTCLCHWSREIRKYALERFLKFVPCFVKIGDLVQKSK
jgi:hypothetical protein